LRLDHDTGREMGDLDSAVCFVDLLAARPRSFQEFCREFRVWELRSRRKRFLLQRRVGDESANIAAGKGGTAGLEHEATSLLKNHHDISRDVARCSSLGCDRQVSSSRPGGNSARAWRKKSEYPSDPNGLERMI